MAATISGGLGLLIGFLRAAVLSGVGELQSERFALVIAVIAIVAGAFALIAWILGVRVKSFEDLVNDASDALSDRGTFLEVVAEIEERSGESSPWLRGKLHEAISAWIDEIGLNVRGSVAELAHRIGPEYFAKLLVAKGLELEVMEEKIGSPDGGLRIECAGLARAGRLSHKGCALQVLAAPKLHASCRSKVILQGYYDFGPCE